MGERKLEQINSALVNSFTTRKLQGDSDGSGKLAPKIVRDIDTLLKSILKYVENEYHTGPLADNTVLPKNKKETVEALTVQEAAHIEAYLWQHRQKQNILLVISLLIKVLLAEDMFICRVSLVNRRK